MSQFEREQNRSSPYLIELQETEELEPERSFYDQVPFNELLDTITVTFSQQEPAISRENFCLALTSIGYQDAFKKFRLMQYSNQLRYMEPGGKMEEAFRDNENVKRFCKVGDLPKAGAVVFAQGAGELIRGLRPYPYFLLYLNRQLGGLLPKNVRKGSGLKNALYNFDGSYMIENDTDQLPPPTYASWVSQQEAIDKFLKQHGILLGIKDVFPQQLGGQSTKEVLSQQGKSLSSMQFRLPKASDIPNYPAF